MKQLCSIIKACILLIGFCILSSCTKEEVGPTGANGNANVKVFLFENEDTLTANHPIDLNLSGITNSYLDSSLILVYFVDQSNALWYPSPGLGANDSYQTKWYIFSNTSPTIELRIANPDGSSYSGIPIYLSQIKIIVAEGS